MTFSDALEKMRNGGKMKRYGWCGQNQYVTIECGVSYMHDGFRVPVNHMDARGNCLMFHGERGTQVWVPSHSDILSDDWIEVD